MQTNYIKFKKSKSSSSKALSWIFKTISKQIPLMVLLILLTSLLATLGTITAFISSDLIDWAVKSNTQKVIYFSVALGLVFLFQAIGSGVSKYIGEVLRAKIEMQVKQRLFNSILNKQYQQVSKYHSGVLLNRLTDDSAIISDAATNILPSVISTTVRLVVAFFAIIYFQPLFALVFLVGGIFVFIITRILRSKLKVMHKNVGEANEKARSFWQEAFSNLLAVKVFGANEQMKSKSKTLQEKHYETRKKRSLFTSISSTGYALLMYIGYTFAFIWCAFNLLNKVANFSYGNFTAIMQLVSQVQQPFSTLSGVIPQYYNAIASIERIMEIESIQDESSNNLIEKDAYLKFKSINFTNLNFKYEKENKDLIFESLDLSINKNEFVGIVGNSGIGKSTLFKLMLGVYSPNSGEITVELEDKIIPCGSQTRKLFAYVPQGHLLFSGTILENITFVNPNASNDLIAKVVYTSCINEFVEQLPNGLQTIIGEKGFGLSEGQVQRIAIARALLSNAPILLLDEATSALDSHTETKLLNNLKELKNVTCVFVTHREKALEICDKQIKIENSKVIVKELKIKI